MFTPDKIRNIAIIAHIDHGKTTLLDALLAQSNIFRENQEVAERVMDSYDQEKERGITIFSKHTSIYHEDFKINVIDTPGHADFSAEVERVLGMVDTVLLIIDAKEGPMPQTRFVLSKSLKMGLKPIVILNKIDRPHADPERALNDTFDLFVELSATDEQLDFRYCYASGIKGYAYLDQDVPHDNFDPLFKLIMETESRCKGSLDNPFLFQAATIAYNDYVGRQACGRILEGKIKKGDTVYHNVSQKRYQITRIEGHLGLEKVEVEEAGVGDIVLLSGIADVTIGDTLCDPNHIQELDPIELGQATVSVDIWVNNGPFVGRSGKHVTMNKIRERLLHEKKANPSYEITEGEKQITIAGRGELHLAVLLEAMRREGYEFCVSKPKVILKEIEGQKCEPIDRVHIEVPEEHSGSVIEQLSRKKGEMQHLRTDDQGICHLEFLIPTRGLMGYRNEFLTSTKGLGILTSIFENYAPHKGEIIGRPRGVLIAMSQGKANAYAAFTLQDRGTLFVNIGEEVYTGMVVGENNRDNDLIVNIIKPKQLSNIRAAGTDENLVISPPRRFNLEEAITYIEHDEWIEVTPDTLRLRKIHLDEHDRKRASRSKD
ncbi:MAG: GTP-binding protein TypA/BipA [Chlamydiales bacterium]|nr:GTP-binding protein TypA/BipA [Chlamydiales bacterium]MCH9619158.1 GTP-binding protein TypA/BipA [Chlamydiales bacterium]MCH9622420.1 GTP-binding protein TypA/BipA [Chlamydiales bacterium]